MRRQYLDSWTKDAKFPHFWNYFRLVDFMSVGFHNPWHELVLTISSKLVSHDQFILSELGVQAEGILIVELATKVGILSHKTG